jgi:Ca2+-binding EF-hand superfamily protein
MISSIGSSNSMYSMTQMRQQMFSKIDTNGDGKHDKTELAAMVANGPTGAPSVDDILGSFDTDGDGAISESEFNAGQEQNQARGAGGPPPPPMGNMSSTDFIKQLFSDSDTDEDGVLSADELSSMVTNGPAGGPSADELLSKLDTDGDGSINESEFIAGAPGQKAEDTTGTSNTDNLFSNLDTNEDGVVSKAEFEAAMNGITSTQSTSQDDFVEKLLEALQNNTTDSSTSSSSASSSSTYQNVSELLSAALKSYMQFSTNGFSQTNASSVLGNSLFA